MTGTNKVKIAADGEPEPDEENSMTSSSSSWCGRRVSRLHLWVIYSLLVVYGLWSATSYQLMRSSLLDELDAWRRGGAVSGQLGPCGIDDHQRANEATRQRRSADDLPVGGHVMDTPSLSRVTRDTSNRRRGNSFERRRRLRVHRARNAPRTQSETEARPRRRQHSRSSRRNEQPRRGDAESVQRGTTIHMHAKPDVGKQFTSNAMVSFNSSGDTTYRFWRKADWVSDDAELVFRLNEQTGHVVVRQPGVYLIYAQMVYHDRTGRWSFGVFVDSREVVKCLSSEQLRDARSLHPTSHGVYQQCNTAITVHLDEFQSLHVRCMYGARTILAQPEFTFWGVVKLS